MRREKLVNQKIQIATMQKKKKQRLTGEGDEFSRSDLRPYWIKHTQDLFLLRLGFNLKVMRRE